jgi:integrase/recombinase XerD
MQASIFDSLFSVDSARDRHNNAPLQGQRSAYLQYLRTIGRKDPEMRSIAALLLQIVRTLKLVRVRQVRFTEVQDAARSWAEYVGPRRHCGPGKYSYKVYVRIAKTWLKFLNCLRPALAEESGYETHLTEYDKELRIRIGLSQSTVRSGVWHAKRFLKWLSNRRVRLWDLYIGHVELYFGESEKNGWQKSTVANATVLLRLFLRFAERRCWCRPGVSMGIIRPRRPRPTGISPGPSWHEVCRMLQMVRGEDRMTLRDKAMLMLFAVYGLRCSEARSILLTDIDFHAKILTVRRGKREGIQRFRLRADVATVLKRYIENGRPGCNRPELFVTFELPYRVPTSGRFWYRTSIWFKKAGIVSINCGPHALRHACASRLLSAGASLAEIASFLGHRDVSCISHYARLESNDLLTVANFSLKGLI